MMLLLLQNDDDDDDGSRAMSKMFLWGVIQNYKEIFKVTILKKIIVNWRFFDTPLSMRCQCISELRRKLQSPSQRERKEMKRKTSESDREKLSIITLIMGNPSAILALRNKARREHDKRVKRLVVLCKLREIESNLCLFFNFRFFKWIWYAFMLSISWARHVDDNFFVAVLLRGSSSGRNKMRSNYNFCIDSNSNWLWLKIIIRCKLNLFDDGRESWWRRTC